MNNETEQIPSLNSLVENAMDGSYERGINYGLTEAQVIFLNILNERVYQITVQELQDEFMKRVDALKPQTEKI